MNRTMTRAKPRRVAITLSAVKQRLNRQLAKEDQVIRAQGGRGGGSGLHFLVDKKKGEVLLTGLDADRLVNMARQRGVMAVWEELR
jgi:hypothetical protein